MMIDENKLIEEMKRRTKWLVPDERGTHSISIETIIKFIKEFPKIEDDKWISCSDRMPEERTLVYCRENDTGKVYSGFWLDIPDRYVHWFDEEGFPMNVDAWMPLPDDFIGE